jgi:hypothetical protein
MIWSDLSLKAMPYWVSTPVPRFNSGNNVATNLRGISLMGKAMTDIIKPNLYDLLMIHGMARGTIVDKKEDADVVFSAETFPFETDVIMSQYL